MIHYPQRARPRAPRPSCIGGFGARFRRYRAADRPARSPRNAAAGLSSWVRPDDWQGGRLMNVVIFTSASCGSCQQAKNFLAEHNIPFLERDLATDSTAIEELMKAGFRLLPVIRVGTQAIQGFDPAALKKLLAI